MASIVISGDTSGTITVSAPAVSGSNTITLPAVTGTAVISGQNSAITAGTAVASTSGTSIDFTSIPSWVKRITVMLNNVSLSGAAYLRIQIGTGGTPTTTGYVSHSGLIATTATNSVGATAGLDLFGTSATIALYGAIRWQNVSGNIWVADGTTANSGGTALVQVSASGVTLSGTLNMVRITTSNGTDTFDAGSINILYE
jgi:hypothetical protein